MPSTGGNRADRAPKTPNVNRGIAVDRRADPHLARGIPAPAFETSTAAEGARVLAPRGDRADTARQTLHVDGNVAIDGSSIAQLGVGVGAPTRHATGSQQRP